MIMCEEIFFHSFKNEINNKLFPNKLYVYSFIYVQVND